SRYLEAARWPWPARHMRRDYVDGGARSLDRRRARGHRPRLASERCLMSGRWLSSALAVSLAAMAATPAAPANPLYMNLHLSAPRLGGLFPASADQASLYKITARFAQKEGSFWRSDLTIVALDKIREVAFRPGPPNTIPRRFCTALAFVSDGFKHPIHYSIGEDTGMIGATFRVEWCVMGLDRNWAYNPACKMARP